MKLQRLRIMIIVLVAAALFASFTDAQTFNATWQASYFDNENLQGSPVVIRSESTPSNNWAFNAPAPGLPTDHWSARWQTTLNLESGRYRINVAADDGVRVLVNGVRVIDEWHGHVSRTYSHEFSVFNAATTITIEFYDESGQAYLSYGLEQVDNITGSGQWLATYFNNENLQGTPVVSRYEQSPGGNWQFAAPAPGVTPDYWSARWSSIQRLTPGGHYRVNVSADDGVRVYINGVREIDEWHGHNPTTYSHTFTAIGDTSIQVELFDRTQQAFLNYGLERIAAEQPGEVGDAAARRPLATVTASVLNVREEPDANSPIMTQIRQGENYTVYRGSITGWVQLIVNGELGWVSDDFVNLSNTQYLVNLAGASEVTITALRLNVRDRPSVRLGEVVTKVNRREHHPIVGQSAGGQWLLIDVNGVFGWVNRDYVDVSATVALPMVSDVPPQIPPETEFIVVVATPYNVNMRSGPGVNFADLGNLPRGEEAKVIGRNADNTWWQIEYQGTQAWVAGAYAQIQENAVIEAIPITSTQ